MSPGRRSGCQTAAAADSAVHPPRHHGASRARGRVGTRPRKRVHGPARRDDALDKRAAQVRKQDGKSFQDRTPSMITKPMIRSRPAWMAATATVLADLLHAVFCRMESTTAVMLPAIVVFACPAVRIP